MDVLAADPPTELFEARAARLARKAERAVLDEIAHERDAVERAAMAAIPSRVPAPVVAELLACPVDIVAGMQPKGGFVPDAVIGLVVRPPWWATDHAKARRQIEARQARRQANNDQLRARGEQKRSRWAKSWARQLGLPVEVVAAARLDRQRPTPAALAAVRRDPPRRLRDALAPNLPAGS